ncbi:hypothetical protein BDU57DRAFT_512016 [Ampelomyces quisqualis]|uniref:Uncharacterized protein n=1 Tax=Ampelomyces quisqualis TaxID=50730 RepID=A0A6A5QUM5_AMPQU|nr:hypothetical protein BDU57DRAFT_512016 [Ampelomyces quisqualis]
MKGGVRPSLDVQCTLSSGLMSSMLNDPGLGILLVYLIDTTKSVTRRSYYTQIRKLHRSNPSYSLLDKSAA